MSGSLKVRSGSADGPVRFIPYNTDQAIMHELATRAGGEVVTLEN